MARNKTPILIILLTLMVALTATLTPLPDAASMLRPALYVMTLLFWTVHYARHLGVVVAWCAGLALDVVYTTPFGEHALALAIAAYIVIKCQGILSRLDLLQQTVLMLPVFVAYEFILFWVDGVAGLSTDQWSRWLPALTSTLLWPIWSFVLHRFAGHDINPD